MGENTERQKQRDRKRGQRRGREDRRNRREKGKEKKRREGSKRRHMLGSAPALRVTEKTGCFHGDSLESLVEVTLKP